MGRHAHPRAAGASRRTALLAGAAVLAILAGLLVWWAADGGNDDTTAAGCTDRRTVRVTVAPAVEQLAGDLLAEPLPLDGRACAVAKVSAQEPLETVAALGALDAGTLPQVWVPDSSLWAARAPDAALEPAGSLASSPLVLATSRAAVDSLGWTLTPPTWGDVLSPGRTLAVPDLAGSAEGLSVLAAVRQSLGSDEDADNAVVQAVLAAGRGDVPSPAQALEAGSAGGADAPLVPVSEQEVIAANRDVGSPALVAVYPREGSPGLDHPVLRVGGGDAATKAVVGALTSDAARDRVLAAGFRDGDGGTPDGAAPETGVRTEAPAALDLDPAALQQLSDRLAGLATPSRLLAVIDVSTSMEARAGNGTRATLARDAAKSALTLLPDAASVGLWVFAARLDGDTDWQELARLERLDVDLDGRSRREALSAELDSVPDRLAPGGTALYDTTLAAVRAARDAYDPTSVNTVVLITDGENDDSAGIGLPELLDRLRTEADPARPVKVVGIALGPDADLESLQQIGDASGGAAYPALDPEDLQSVLFDAIRRRG